MSDKSGTSAAARSSATSSRLSASAGSSGASKSPKRSRNVGGEGEEATSMEELFKPFEIGDGVWAINKGSWHKAKVVKKAEDNHPENKDLQVPTYFIHYPGWPNRWDEWLMGDSMMAFSPENDKKAELENQQATAKPSKLTDEKSVTRSGKKSASKAPKPTATKSAVNEESAEPVPATPAKTPAKKKKAKSATPAEIKEPVIKPPMKTAIIPAKLTKAVPALTKRGSRAVSASTTTPAQPEAPPVSSVEAGTSKESEEKATLPPPSGDEKVPSNAFVTPRVSPTSSSMEMKSESGAGEEPSLSGPPSVEAPAQENRKRERSYEEFCLLCDHYDAYDKSRPNESSVEEQALIRQVQLSYLTATPDPGSDATGSPTTPGDREKSCLDALHKMAYIEYARRCKALDTTVLRVTLPDGLKRMMAVNYINTVRAGKILKAAPSEHSMEAILTAYRDFCEKNPRKDKSVYWNLARAAELDVFMDPEIFNAFLPSFLYRHEWPQMEDWKRGSSSKKDKGRELFQKYGLLHLARYIQRMCFHHNMESKRSVGRMGQQLIAIYDDMLNFIEREYVTKFSETDLEELYQDMEPSYMQRIKFITFGVLPGRNGEQTSGLVIMPFHMLPDSFFDQLLAKPLTGPEALTITWRKAPALGDSSKMENGSD